MADNNRTQWSIKPFISFDGGDGKGGPPAEVVVSKGVGTIFNLGDTSNRSTRVTIKVEKRRYDFTGWVNTDDKVFSIAKEHYKTGDPVQFRIEVQRKIGQDRSTPIRELQSSDSKDNVKRILVGLGEPDGELTLSREHLTDPDRDTNGEGGVAADSRLAVAAAEAHRSELAAGGDIEARPWIGTNNDGSINAGSYAINGDISLYFVIRDRFPEADDDVIHATVESLLGKMDIMQLAIYGWKPNGGDGGVLKGRPNRFCNSYAMARKIVEGIIARDGSDVDIADDEANAKWQNGIARESLKVWSAAMKGYEDFLARDK